jgi:hypothetical protein
MTETITTTTEAPPRPAPQDTGIHLEPEEVLMHLVVTVLMPMFIGATGGDMYLARLAAFDTVNAYRFNNHVDLLSVAHIVAFGLVALGSLSLSMADDLTLSMTLRLRGCANALHRSGEQSRRALKDDLAQPATPHRPEPTVPTGPPPDPVADAGYEAAVIAGVAETQKRVAEANARLRNPAPAAERTPASIVIPPAQRTPASIGVPAAAAPAGTDLQHQAMWAAAMINVAAEYTAGLHNLPPTARKLASRRAAALSSTANTLLSGTVPTRPRPGDLAAIIRPNPI